MRAIVLVTATLFALTAQADALHAELAAVDALQPTASAAVNHKHRAGRRGRNRSSYASAVHNESEGQSDWDAGEDRRELAALVALLDERDGAEVDRSTSRGTPHEGSLHGAVQVPDHAGYIVRDRLRAWGKPNAVQYLVQAFDEVVAGHPRAPRVRVHDLSLRYGGPMDGHKSHQSGRDVDMTYYQRGCGEQCLGHRVAPGELDAERQWQLLRHWLKRDVVEFIFVDYLLQRPLYESALASGATSAELARWFQYPRGSAFPAGIIRHIPNHANHVHVRFRCGEGERRCKGTPTRHVSHGVEGGMRLLELIEDESENELLEQIAE